MSLPHKPQATQQILCNPEEPLLDVENIPMKLLHFKCLKIRTKVSEAVSLLPLFNRKNLLSDESTLFFFWKFLFLSCISHVPELLPSSVTNPWCALMLHHSCLISHSYPPKPKRGGENTKAALLSLPQQLSIQCCSWPEPGIQADSCL